MLAGLQPTDRIAVLGARGWFGQTLVGLLPADVPILLTASRADELHGEWSWEQVQEFAPTVVANFAFLTRERIASEGVEEFTTVNTRLIDQFQRTASLSSVRAVLTVSSGAAVTEPDKPYGALKLIEERVAGELASPDRASVVLRAYSVSGPFVRRPRDYAFSDFIVQAHEGRVSIAADELVFRRYVSVSDALTVAARSALSGWSGTVDTGGELVEMGELAQRVVSVVNPTAVIERPEVDHGRIQTYASDDASWVDACERLGYVPMDLDEQIRVTARGLLEELPSRTELDG